MADPKESSKRHCPAYGHTPGHTMYEVESKGESFFFGAISSMSPQCNLSIRPSQSDMTSTVPRPNKSIGVSSMMLRRIDTLIAGAHLPFPGLGHVRNNGRQSLCH